MAVQVKLYSPTGTETDITSRLIDDWPNLDITLERETCAYTPGELAFTAKNEDGFFNTLFSGADPNARFNETTQLGAWAVKVYKSSTLRWVGNVDVESITFSGYALNCSFNCLGRLARLERYNAAKVKRALPDGTDATVLTFTCERGRRLLDFSATSERQAWYTLLEVGDVLHVSLLHPSTGKFSEQDVTVKEKQAGYIIKVKEKLEAAYTYAICNTPFYRNKTLGYLLIALWAHAQLPGGSYNYNTPYANYVVEYADFTGKNVAEALAEFSKCFYGKLIANATSNYLFQDRASTVGGTPTKDITNLLADGADLKLIDEEFYDLIVMRGRSPVRDKEHVVRVGHCTYPKRELEIQTDFIYDHDTLEEIATNLYNAWSVRRNRYEAKVLDDGTAYTEGQTVIISGASYWVLNISEPLRSVDADFRDVITLTLLAQSGTTPDAEEVDVEADIEIEPPEPPTIVACTKTYPDWPTMKAQYPSLAHARVVVESGSWKDDAGDLHVFYKKWRMFFCVLSWPYDDLKAMLAGFRIVVFKDGDDPEDEKWDYAITEAIQRSDSGHPGAGPYYWRPIKVLVDSDLPGHPDWRVSAQAIYRNGQVSEWSDDVILGYEGEDSTLPVPVIDSITAEKKKVTIELSIPDSPEGSRAHVGWFQVFKSVGTTAVGTPETSPSNWRKIKDEAIDDDIRAGRYAFEVTGSFKNAEQRYFCARCAYVDNKDTKGAFCTAVSASDSGSSTVASVAASPSITGMQIDDDNSTNKTEMTFDVTIPFINDANLGNKDRVEVYLKKSTNGGATYPISLPVLGADVAAGDTTVAVNVRRLVKKNQWIKIVKTVVWQGDSARVQQWGIVTQVTAVPLAIASSGVTPATGDTGTTFNFSVAATGGTAGYTYAWVFDSAVTYMGGTNAASQNPQVRFSTDGAHWGKCTVTDGSSPAQSVATNQLMVTVGAGPGVLKVTLSANKTSGRSPLTAVILTAAASGGSGSFTKYVFDWETGSQDAGASNVSAQFTLKNFEGLFNGGTDKVVLCRVVVTDSAGNTGQAWCTITVYPPYVQRWSQSGYQYWEAVVQNGSGNAWTSSGGTSDLSAAIDASNTTYVKCSIPSGEGTNILWLYGLSTKPALAANARVLMIYVALLADPRDSTNTNLVQNMETKWFRFTKNSIEQGIKYGVSDEWMETYMGGIGSYPWEPLMLGGYAVANYHDPNQVGLWSLSDVNNENYIGFKLKVKNVGTVTKVARFYGAKLHILYALD